LLFNSLDIFEKSLKAQSETGKYSEKNPHLRALNMTNRG
jgi:hypothetical protein